MEIGATGRPDSPVPALPPVNPLPAVAPQAPQIGQGRDRIAATLQDLAAPQVGQLLHLLDHNQDPMMLDGLLKAAVASVHAHRLPEAMRSVQSLIAMNPELGPHMVRSETGLQPIHHEVQDLLHRMTMGAKVDAERALVLAHIAIQTAPNRIVEPSGLSAQDLLGLGKRFFESGEYLNYIRATQIGGMVLTQYPGSGIRKAGSISWLALLWKRAPLAVLLLGWLAVGIAAWVIGRDSIGSGAVEVWVTGFLGLVLFQFFATVRKFR